MSPGRRARLLLLQVVERQRRARLDALDREVAADVADAGQLQQRAGQEMLIAGEIGQYGLEQEIGLA